MENTINKKDLPRRKSIRLKNYDYSSSGAYFVTICVQDRRQLLSEIIKVTPTSTEEPKNPTVGEGLAPPEYVTKLKPCGEVVREQLQQIENRFPCVKISDYVIMPDHIHIILFIQNETGGASPSPTLSDIICAFKSLTSLKCKQKHGEEKIFQRSYSEHVIRNQQDYNEHIKYIYENPVRWYLKYPHAEQ